MNLGLSYEILKWSYVFPLAAWHQYQRGRLAKLRFILVKSATNYADAWAASQMVAAKMNGFEVVRDFEKALCEYTGAKFACATRSCTDALLLCCAYLKVKTVEIPRFTYHGVPMAVLNAGGNVTFHDRPWRGSYTLDPYAIKDSARRFYHGMYTPGHYECVSFHVTKILGIDQGGAILHDDEPAQDIFLAMSRDGKHPNSKRLVRGFHCYMSPGTAAEGIRRLASVSWLNQDLHNDPNYLDLSQQDIFK